MAKNDRLETLNKIGWGKKKEDNQENTSTKNSRLATLSNIGWGNNGVANDNGLDDVQKAARARTVALRNYENELWKYRNGKTVNKNGLDKTQQAARDRAVWARQPAMQEQLSAKAKVVEAYRATGFDGTEESFSDINKKLKDAYKTYMKSGNDSDKKAAETLSKNLDVIAENNPDLWVSKNTHPALGISYYTPYKNKAQAFFQGKIPYVGNNISLGSLNTGRDLIDAAKMGKENYTEALAAIIQPPEEADKRLNELREKSQPYIEELAKKHTEDETKRAQELYEKYSPDVTSGYITGLAADAAQNFGYNAPYQAISMIPGIGQNASMLLRGAGTYVGAYGDAREKGADIEQATAAAAAESANQAVFDRILSGMGGTGKSALGKIVGKTGVRIASPAVKAILNSAGAVAEEMTQEVIQDLASYGIEKTYNPDAKLDPKSLGRTALVTAISTIPGVAMAAPSHYSNYQSDINLMDYYNSTAGSIKSETDFDAATEIGETIKKSCDDIIKDANAKGDDAAKQRAENIKRSVETAQKAMNDKKDFIIKNNTAKKSALDNAIDNSRNDVVKNIASLVDEVAKGNTSKKNDINATIDYVTSQSEAAYAEALKAQQIGDTEAENKHHAEFLAYQEIAKTLRNERKSIQDARATTETNGKVLTGENGDVQINSETTTVETPENAPKTTEKQESSTEKSDSIRETTMKDMGILGVNKDIDTAADELVSKYGSYKNAVDAVIKAQDSVRHDATISDEEKQSRIHRLQDIDRSIRNRNTARMKSYTDALSEKLKQYGVSGVKIMDVENDNVRSSTKVNGYYDPRTKTVYVSPYLDDARIAGAVAVHEFTHYGARADHSLVNDILKAKDTLVKSGTFSEAMFDFAKYESAYTNEVSAYIASEDGRNEISALMQDGMTEEQAKAQASKDYVNEEIAAHFMQEILSKDDALDRLAKENRPLLKRILDAIVDFFSGKDAQNRRLAERAADKIRAVLRETEDVEVGNSRKSGKSTARMQSIADKNAKIGNTGDDRRFSLTRPTEEAGSLIAVHNVNKEKALKILDADGMPMPSIAIAKADIGHSDFGNISFVFGAETVDPKANRYNKVYSADVWSPTFPSIEYETNQATESRIVALYNSIKSKYGSDIAKALYPYYTNLSYELDSKGGAKGIISVLYDDTGMMNVFLADTGETPVKNVVKETSTEMSANTREMAQYLIDTRGADFLNDANRRDGETSISARNRFLESHEQELRDTLQKYYERNGIDAETAKIVVESTRKGELMNQLVKPAQSILSGNTTTTSTTVDYEATNEKILDTVDKKKYKEWLNNLFGDAVKNEGIRNEKDPFTPPGNRRSFSATHYPVTLDNIVKAMRGSGNVKGATTMTENAKAIRSASAEEYKSIDAIHKNEGRLRQMSEPEITAQWDAFDNRLYAIIDSLMDSVPTIDDRFIESRRIGQVIIEASRNPTESNIRSTLEKYSGKGAWYKFTDQTVSDIQSLVNDIREAPTNIFEAKPERVVSLDEIKYAVVPDDLDKDTVQRIADKGIEVRTYESDNEESRLETLNKLDGVRFSKDVDTETDSRYDYSKSFAEQIDDYVNGKIPNYDTLVVGKTPEVFQEIGLTPLPMTYGTGHLKEVLNGTKKDHDFGVEVLKRVPEALESPVAIIASKTKPESSIVAILDLSSRDKPLFAAVEIDGYGKLNGELIDSNAITSIHVRNNASSLLSNAIENDTSDSINLFYVDKEKATRLLDGSGVQFPGATALPDGYVHSIHDNGSPVKSKFQNVTQSKQFKRWFGDWETHPEGASKVVNEDGTPKVMYHGTSSFGFTMFDYSHQKFGLFGIGSYFTDDIDVATSYTEKGKGNSKGVYAVYLNIKNPLDMDKNANIPDWNQHAPDAEGYFNNCQTNEDCFKALKEYCADEYMTKYEAEEYIQDVIRGMGYDGITHIGGGRFNKNDETRHRVYIAFDPEQIKSATDNIGTFDRSNPDIRYSKEIDREYMNAVEAGDMDKVREMIRKAAEEKGFTNAIPEQASSYITRTKAAPKNTIKVYKVFTVAPDGSPTALFVSSTTKLPMNVWLDAVDTYHFKADNGKEYVPSTQNPYTKGGKTGASVTIPNEQVRSELVERGYLSKDSKAAKITALAYRPGWHAGDLPFFPQGGKQGNPRLTNSGNVNKAFNPDIQETAYENIHRYNQVVFECEMAADTNYTEIAQNQEKAKTKSGSVNQRNADLQYMPTDGFYYYTTNPTISEKGKWAISGSLKINRALTQQECDDILSKNGFKPQEWEGGTLDLEKLGYTGETYDAAKKTFAPITYDDDGNVIPISERFNKDIKDIRYSKDVFTPEEREKIISKGYTDYLARQFVVKDRSGKHAKAISISSRKKLAQQLAKPLKGVNASDALVAITPVFETIEKADGTPEQRAEKAYKAAEKAANDIISMMKDVNTNTLYDQYAELRNYLRTTKLDTSSVKADIADYNDWRKSHMGSMKLGNDGMQIDTVYQELSGMYPEFFPANIENPADQLIHIGEISDNLKKVMDNPILSKEGSEGVVRSFANAILSGYEEYAQETLGSQNSRMRDYVKTAAESIEQKNAQIKDAQEQLADTKADFRRFAETVQTAYETDVKHLNEQIQARDKSIARLEKYVSKTEKGAMEVSRKKAISAFAKLQKTYDKPTATNGVPENWKGIVSSMLNAFGNEDHAINAQTAIDQLAKMETLVSDSKRYDSKSVRVSPEQMENLSWQISGLRTFFENFSESQKTLGTDANNSVDIATSKNAAYIDSVRNLAETVNHLIRAENELFVGEKKAEASAIAYDFIDEIRERGKKFEKTGSESGPLKQWANSAVLDYTAPDVFLHNLGETGDQFAKAYREAQNKSTLLNQQYGEAMHSLVGENYSADRTGIKGELIDVSINGENLKVSRQQLMSLYLLWKRPQARQHIKEGGVYFLNANGEQQGKPIVIHESEYRSLIGKLSSEDIRIADGVGKYLSETCAEWGNEASMKLYGYKKFNDPNYFPITVHGMKDQYHDEIYSVTNSLEHKSFTKHVDKNSVKALDIHDIFSVSDNHAKEMAQYSGFAPVNNAFTRVYNAPGVQTALLEQYGRRAIVYMNDFLDRANGKPVGKDTKAADASQKLASMAKKAAVGFNVSTAMKQPISYLRAAPELDMDVFAKAGVEIFSPSQHKALYNEMVTNSGIARIKALGFSDVGIGKEARGNYSDLSFSSAYNKGKFVKSKFEDASMWLAGKADEITWVRIWDACKMQIDKENAKLSAEKRIQLTTEKFNQIVGRTQVVDSVLDSAPASYNSVFKILHPFMNEPMKTVSSLWYAYEEMKKGVPGGKQKFVKQIAATAASNLILEPLIASVIGALRDKEDEDPEKFAEKVLNKMSGISLDSEEPTSFRSVATSEIISGIAFAPMASFFYSIFTDVLNGFEGDSMNSANLYEFMKASVKLTEALMKGEGYSGQKSIYNLAAECATSMAQAFGIPANTMRKDLNAVLRTALYYTQDIVPMNNIVRWEMNKLYYNLGNKSARTEKYFYDILIDAYNQEDKTAYNIMREDLDEMGIQSKEIVEIIEKRNGAIKPGSSVWNTELQARFDLPTKSTSSQVEQMVTRVYAACQKIDTLDESKALPKRPDKYSYTDRHGDKVEMSTQEYDKFVEDVGVLRYKLCAEFASSNAWSKLVAEQQLYAITKAYDFAARYYRQQFNAEYDSGDTWMKELYGKQLRIKDVATTIISKAFKK